MAFEGDAAQGTVRTTFKYWGHSWPLRSGQECPRCLLNNGQPSLTIANDCQLSLLAASKLGEATGGHEVQAGKFDWAFDKVRERGTLTAL